MIDSSLDPQSGKAHRLQRDAERLHEWVVAKTAELEAAWVAQDTPHTDHSEGQRSLPEQLLDRALNNEWEDCPLGEDDPRWNDVNAAWRAADAWRIGDAITILEAL